MRFPYVQERSKFLPIISMQIKSKVKVDWITFDAFVDSGASYSIFKAEIGDILGLELVPDVPCPVPNTTFCPSV